MGHKGRIMDLVLRMGLGLRDLRPLASFLSFKLQSILVNSTNKGFSYKVRRFKDLSHIPN